MRDPIRVTRPHSGDSRSPDPTEFLYGREAIGSFLTRKWNRELGTRNGKISQANWTFWPASRLGGPFISLYLAIAIFRWCVFHHGIVGDNCMELVNDAQIAMERGMIIAEINIAIGAIDRILKMTKDGRSNNRELTNARLEQDHWRARLLKAVHKG
jgi:hypothetical protein